MSSVSIKGTIAVVEFKPFSGTTEASVYGSRLEMITAMLHDGAIGDGMIGSEAHVSALKDVAKEVERAIYCIEHRSIWD